MVEIRTAYKPIDREFFARPTDEVAVDLLGQLIVREVDEKRLVGRLVEVEAYFGRGDPASHACRGMTPRNTVMFGPPGYAYVYLNYGVHWLLNVVTEDEGTAGAVLLRAMEPIDGIEEMLENRRVSDARELGNGPGKLTKSLCIGAAENGADMTDSHGGLYIAEGSAASSIRRSGRIGISAGADIMLRFYVEDSAFISRKV